MTRFRKPKYCRAIVALLAIAWLPFVTTLCLDAEACDYPAAGGHHGDHESHHHGIDTPSHHQEHSDAPASTCCELTGKRAVALTAQPGLMAAPSAAVSLVSALPAICSVAGSMLSPAVVRAHGPPTYLRNASLRI